MGGEGCSRQDAEEIFRHALLKEDLPESGTHIGSQREFDQALAICAAFHSPADFTEQFRLAGQEKERRKGHILETCAWLTDQKNGGEGGDPEAYAAAVIARLRTGRQISNRSLDSLRPDELERIQNALGHTVRARKAKLRRSEDKRLRERDKRALLRRLPKIPPREALLELQLDPDIPLRDHTWDDLWRLIQFLRLDELPQKQGQRSCETPDSAPEEGQGSHGHPASAF